MKRTIQIGDKYKNIMDEYDALYDKEEFNVFIMKLLILNKELKDRNIDICIVGDIIKNYNIDFFSLMNCLSTCSQNNSDIINNVNNTNNTNNLNNTVINTIPKKQTKIQKEKNSKEIVNKDEKNIVNNSNNENINDDISIQKESIDTLQNIKNNIIDNKEENKIQSNVNENVKENIKENVKENKKENVEEVQEDIEEYDPILSLNINLAQ